MPSILAVFLLVLGVALSNPISNYDDATDASPIVVNKRRICAELCNSGLGGEPCGSCCQDYTSEILLQKSTIQYENSSGVGGGKKTRQAICPVLCANGLGYPLCQCKNVEKSSSRTNFAGICWKFCQFYNYKVDGCPKCSAKNSVRSVRAAGAMSQIDWNAWCVAKCREGDGGAACYCDVLPMSG